MGQGTGFGKTILIGDQFVLEGVPAIVSALPHETVARVERIDGTGWILEDNRMEVPGYKEKKKSQQVKSIDRILEVMGIDATKTPVKITYGGNLPAGSGVGASAASCVSLARALDREFGLGLSVEELNRVAWEGEFPYHGIPSGVDNTASTYGGLLFFRVRDGRASHEPIRLRTPLDLVLANSGVTADTSLLDAYLEEEKARNPDLFRERLAVITGQARDMRDRLEKGDKAGVGGLMTSNHRILIEMGLSHDTLVSMCSRAVEMGALGAKLTGGGRGGYMVALTPGRDLQERVAAVFEDEGFTVIRATIG